MTPPPVTQPLLREGLFTEAALRAPARLGVAALARHRIEVLRAARLRLGAADDPEALHDFRVSMRRLRSVLRGYRPVLGKAVPRRLRRRLRRLARATNPSRDFEVKLAWLKSQDERLRPRDRVGLRWLVARLEEGQRAADSEARDLIDSRFEDRMAALEKGVAALEAAAAPEDPSLAAVTAQRLAQLLATFRRRWDKVRGIGDQAAAHQLRIAGKRIRYLLEPLAGVLPTADAAVARFKALQDVTGEMHDADVLAGRLAEAMEDAAAERGQRVADRLREYEALDRAALRRERRRDPMPGLLELADAVRRRRQGAWETLETEWLAHSSAATAAVVEELVAALERMGPKLGVEVERKYLLREVPERTSTVTPVEIEQGYLPGELIQERIRRVSDPAGVRWLRTLKNGIGLVRSEVEEPTTEAVFTAMWPLTEGRRVRKRRYRIPEGNFTWEIDVFADRDLVLAEVELESAEQQPALPVWLAPHVVREVTKEPEYLNVSLAR